MRIHATLSALCLIGFLGALPSRAVMPVGVDSDPPVGTFLAACRAGDETEAGYPWTHGSGTALGVGQTFRLTRGATLDRLTFRLRQEYELAGAGADLSLLRLRDGSWELIAFQSGPLPWDLPENEAVYVTLDPADVALEAETTYAFLLEIAGGGHVNAAGEILHVGADRYSGGKAFRSEGGHFVDLPYDLEFFLQGSAQTAGDALLLNGDRFAVTATWRDSQGGTGIGKPVPLTESAGYFWFFSAENVELVVKVLDACKKFDRYWVFAAGLTNLEVTLRVEDTEGGVAWEHTNPLERPFGPVLDGNAFATCP